MRIALVSLNQSWEDKDESFLQCETFIESASNSNVKLIIFPEMTLTGFSMNIAKTSEDETNSRTIKSFQKLAKKYNIAIVFGVTIKENKEQSSNRAFFIDDGGNMLNNYIKVHPFSLANEDKYFIAGNELCVVDYLDLKFAITICYDLRFTELYSALSKISDVIINIANWPEKRVEHWNTLLKARAIENQLYTIGVNRTGADGNGLTYVESSNIFDANGESVQYLLEQKNMKIYEIDKQFTKELQQTFNTIQDKKHDLYKKWAVNNS